MLGGGGWVSSKHTNSLLFSVKVEMVNVAFILNLNQVGRNMGAVIAIWVVASK